MPLRKRFCPATVISTDGWAFGYHGRSHVVYTDKISRVYVQVEPPTKGKLWWLYAEQMSIGSWDGVLLEDEARRALVLERVTAALEFSGYTVEIH